MWIISFVAYTHAFLKHKIVYFINIDMCELSYHSLPVVEQGYNHFSWQGWRKVWQMGEE
jgi:hypothetical protein